MPFVQSPAPISDSTNALARIVVDSAYQVHRHLGPGLLERVYETCLVYELEKRNVPLRQQVKVPVYYDGRRLDTDLRIDLLVADELIVELKAIDAILPVHKAQVLTYLKLTDRRLGLLINFNVPTIKQGISRVAR
jgi:GxxExxY protein